jgi:4-hydroxy-tetrahydrodipicolinate synthase
MNKELTGVIPAVISPLKNTGELDTNLLAIQVSYLSKAGASGFFVAGTTAEGAYLTTDEKRAAFATIKDASEASGGEQFFCLACIQPSTEKVISEMKELKDLNPDYLVAVTPYYGKVDQIAVYNHYCAIADEVDVPLLLYNIPAATNNAIELSTIEKLSHHENIVGIKDSSGDLISFSRGIFARRFGMGTPKEFTWIMGEDYLDAGALSIGCDALVSGLGNVRIEPYVAMFEAAKAGRQDEVFNRQYTINRLYDLVKSFHAGMLVSIKAGAAYYGRCSERMKMPGQVLSNEEKKKLEEALKNYD